MKLKKLKHKIYTLVTDRRILFKKIQGSLIYRFLPDKYAIKLVYKNVFGHSLNLENPRTFNEKLQWLKLYNRKPEYTTLVDKIEVKKVIAKLIGEEYIIPTLAVYDNFDEIDFSVLPDKFVIKTNHGGGNTGVVICRDKSHFDVAAAKRKIEKSLATDTYIIGREWPYKNVKRRILIETLLEQNGKVDLVDYKFFCFNGQPVLCQVIQDRSNTERIDFFDMEWRHQDFVGLTPGISMSNEDILRPSSFDKMKSLAAKISSNLPFVRVDFYNVNNSVFFGETTFFPASGFGTFTPSSYDSIIGAMLQLSKNGGGGKSHSYNDIASDKSIRDYKFFCFNGNPKFLKVDFNREINHQANYYNFQWELLNIGEVACRPNINHIELKPLVLDKMIQIARIVSKNIPFVRVDLYYVRGQIYFGEMTFYPASGFGKFTDIDCDILLGKILKIQ